MLVERGVEVSWPPVPSGDGDDDLDRRGHERRRAVPVPAPAGARRHPMRVAFVGAGAIARTHIGMLADAAGTDVVAVCDPAASSGRARPRPPGARRPTPNGRRCSRPSGPMPCSCARRPGSHAPAALGALAARDSRLSREAARAYAGRRLAIARRLGGEPAASARSGYQWRSLEWSPPLVRRSRARRRGCW